jgi:hypothetical protein
MIPAGDETLHFVIHKLINSVRREPSSRDSVVSAANEWAGRPRRWGSSPDSNKNVLFIYIAQAGSLAHSTPHPVGTGGSLAEGKAIGYEAHNSPSTSVEVKKV